MKLAAAIAMVCLTFAAGCDRGTAPRGESGTNTAPVPDKVGEKASTGASSSSAAQAERGSGTTATNSAGTTTGSSPTESVGATTK